MFLGQPTVLKKIFEPTMGSGYPERVSTVNLKLKRIDFNGNRTNPKSSSDWGIWCDGKKLKVVGLLHDIIAHRMYCLIHIISVCSSK